MVCGIPLAHFEEVRFGPTMFAWSCSGPYWRVNLPVTLIAVSLLAACDRPADFPSKTAAAQPDGQKPPFHQDAAQPEGPPDNRPGKFAFSQRERKRSADQPRTYDRGLSNRHD